MTKFTQEEKGILSKYFSNIHDNVFALKNLPEVVKGALFARYSRTHKPMRRLFLDEFYNDDFRQIELIENDTARASALYEKAFNQFGDDSIAQLGGAHIGIEGLSIYAAKLLQRSRVASYLESSTRYMPFNGGVYDEYLGDWYEMVAGLQKRLKEAGCERPLDLVRLLLPLGTKTNMGIFASGLSYERMIMRHDNAEEIKEVRDIIIKMRKELDSVIPDFMVRTQPGHPHGDDWKKYYEETHRLMGYAGEDYSHEDYFEQYNTYNDLLVDMITYPTGANDDFVAHMVYPYSNMSFEDISWKAYRNRDYQTKDIYYGGRRNRRHLPGRALETLNFGFEIVSDYATFRDIQRHRMMTIQNQPVNNMLGYCPIDYRLLNNMKWSDRDIVRATYKYAVEEANRIYIGLRKKQDERAIYVLPQAVNIRYVIHANLRQLVYMMELRSQPQGHITYRDLVSRMHEQIKEAVGSWALSDLKITN